MLRMSHTVLEVPVAITAISCIPRNGGGSRMRGEPVCSVPFWLPRDTGPVLMVFTGNAIHFYKCHV